MTFNNLINLINENNSDNIVLFVGCEKEKAKNLLENGWEPNLKRDWSQSAHGGQGRYLYLTNDPENAKWYGPIVLSVLVNKKHLIVDPEDGIADSVEEELNNPKGLPGNVALIKSLPNSNFSVYKS